MSVRLLWVAGALFLVGLFLPALAIVQKPILWGRPHDELMFGIQCFALSMLVGPAALANAMLFCALLMYAFGGTHRGRYIFAACAASVGLVSAMATPYLLGDMLRYPHVGYFAWVASIGAFAAASVARASELSAARRSAAWVPLPPAHR